MKRMTKPLALLLVLALLCALLPQTLAAEAAADVSDGTFLFRIVNENAFLIGVADGVELQGVVTLPDAVKDIQEYTVQSFALHDQPGITGIVISPHTKKLEKSCFDGLYGLHRVILPKDVLFDSNFVSNCENLDFVYYEEDRADAALAPVFDLPARTRVYVNVPGDNIISGFANTARQCPTDALHYDPLIAEAKTEGEFTYVITDGKATVIAAPMKGEVTIPATLGGAPVCWLLPSLFSGTPVSKVTLPDTVEELPYQCFYDSEIAEINLARVRSIGTGCFALTKRLRQLELPACEKIGNSAFYQAGLQKIELPEGVQTVGKKAFAENASCTQISLPQTLRSIGAEAFSQTKTGNLSIPASLTVIPDRAFYQSVDGKLSLPNTLTEIGGFAFSECAITEMKLPQTLRQLRSGAFSGSRIDCDLTVPGSVEAIGDSAFSVATLKKLTVCEGVQSIGRYAFAAATVGELVLPESLTALGVNAFGYSEGPQTLTIPGNITQCGGAFQYCPANSIYGRSPVLEEEVLEAGIRYFDLDTGEESQPIYEKEIDGVRYKVKSTGAILLDGITAAGELALPAEIDGRPLVKIEKEAFQRNASLTAVTVPDSVKELGESAFRQCEALETVRLGDGITAIPNSCFRECRKLQQITLPKALENIGRFAFASCQSLTEVSLPEGLREIGESAFLYSAASVLLPSSVEKIGQHALFGCGARLLYLSESFDYSGLYNAESDFLTVDPITDRSCLVYRKGTRAEEYVELLRKAGQIDVFAWALPEEDGLVVTHEGVYRLTEDHAELLFCPIPDASESSELALYDTVGGLPVTVIRENAMQSDPQKWDPVWAYLGENVTTIGANAFSTVHDLRILVPENVTKIDPTAFEGCNYVTIYGAADSEAERFAREQGIPFMYYPLPFADVNEGAWYYEAVGVVFNNGLMTGVERQTFAPGKTVTRAQLAQVLYNMYDKPAENWVNDWEYGFADVPGSAWYAKPVNWGVSVGLFNGVSRTQFAPNSPLTREQLVTVFYRCVTENLGRIVTHDADLSGYTDAEKISDYAVDAMRWAVEAGIINGVTETRLSPKGTANRAQLAAILERFIRYLNPG